MEQPGWEMPLVAESRVIFAVTSTCFLKARLEFPQGTSELAWILRAQV